ELYPDPLVEDLSKLTLEERNYGYRLSAKRDKAGHADKATALAIANGCTMPYLGAYMPTFERISGTVLRGGGLLLNHMYSTNVSRNRYCRTFQRFVQGAPRSRKRGRAQRQADGF